ncbi:MAG: response regulator, partial [Clostridiales bacterium]|nr:response regulator [Clostridiales bacterium]
MRSTLLIVDDVDINIEMLKEILADEYNIETAQGGGEAIAQLQLTKPDLVLLDLYMPEIDGFAVLKFMKSREELKGIPVIFVTGEHDEAAEENGLALGAVDYVKKPYNASVVSARVRNHADLKAYRDKLEEMVQERTLQLEQRSKELADANEAIIMGMSLMSESHDKVTGAHIGRIKEFTRMVSDYLLTEHPEVITPKLANEIIMYSPLHDVGKIAITDTILKKTGVLT